MNQRTGLAATLAIVCALGSFVATCSGHPLWGLVAAVLSLPLGVVGLLMAASPRVGGGILSIVAIVLGGIAVVIAILGVIGVIVM